MSSKLQREFYTQPTNQVARQILGKVLARQAGDQYIKGKIVEVESYLGPEDKAAHVRFGQTERNRIIFQKAGLIYIYLCYGMYWQLNITTTEKKAECILIRALEPQKGIDMMRRNRLQYSQISEDDLDRDNLTDGPGKLCQSLNLDESFYGEDITTSTHLWIESGEEASPQIVADKRVGIDYAEEWADKKLRFYIKDNPFVSTN